MSTFSNNLQSTFVKIGKDIKDLRTKTGSIENLTTEQRNSLVDAINYLKNQLDNIDLSLIIDDSLSTSNSYTYSIDKIKQTIKSAINELIAGAPDAFDTLNELALALQSNDNEIATILNALDNRVSYEAQIKTELQKTQARANIGAVSLAEVVKTEDKLKLIIAYSNLQLIIGSTQADFNAKVNAFIGEIGDPRIDFLSSYNEQAGNLI